jgi:hypothetical protein
MLVEWLIRVEKAILLNNQLTEVLKSMNGGYIKIIKETKDEIIIALPINPEKLNLPKEVKREKVKNDPSCWERWSL